MPDSTQPYGFWPSAWSSTDAAAASRDFAELRVGLGGVLWSQFDPLDGRTCLWLCRAGQAQCLTPAGFSLRSRVYEYGGGAFCVGDSGVAFVNESDQQLYWQDLAAPPRALTARADCRYGDLHFDPQRQAVLALEEQHGREAVQHRLVRILVADGAREVLVEGADFYAAPTLSGDGQRLAWIEWDRPQQPWLATRLCVAELDHAGRCQNVRVLAGQAADESLQQPCFDDHGRLLVLSDRQGFWQPWREDQTGQLQALACAAADHAAAPWQLGARNYLALAAGHLLLSWWEAGFAVLAESGAGAGQPLAQAYSRFRQLAADAEYFYLIAGAVDGLSAVLAIDRRSQHCQVLAGGELLLPVAQVSRPQALRFATSDGETCHGFFYPPHNPACRGPVASKPPLLVFVHGGPTSACYPTFDPRIQFWTQRGFAVADLNYRGSSNFGRAYRLRLQGAWGEVEVADAEALVGHLSEQGWIDPARAFIRGASAGGFTTLCALAFGRMFAGGASLYGVSDPLSLRRSTHKFEGDYLDWLLGDPQQHAERYQARTPLLHSERIVAPLIFFQGGLDAVVLPAQTERMVAALRSRGVAVEYHCYADERHGFRQAAHLAHALEAELGFYRQLLSS
ncbi:MAG TPA: prolyl oligopeptidase family serine peptidase [Pseudomonas sp.]|uniref:alpha/beta hydrolase family protein n=1 Tax=Pseudomonas sp. TaxID=306 RepID=UPI002C30702A|nr:prolyl oligopeptidase family serine peptidase [Pseudomonas sp.]HRL92438.1 prolyl oligopeptidase family serine peptidase [Pseudomonas sp.]